EIALDHIDAGGEEGLVRVAPPDKGAWVGKVDDPALGQWRQYFAERAGTGSCIPAEHVRVSLPVGQQIAARGEIREQRRMHRYVRVFPDADSQMILLDGGQRGARIRETVGIPFEIEARLDVPR